MNARNPCLDKLFPTNLLRELPSEDHKYKILSGDYPGKDFHLKLLEEAIKFGYEREVLNKDKKYRLQNGNYNDFIAIMNELLVGRFLERVGTIKAEPQGRNKHIGEFEIQTSPPVFVEVKTLFVDDVQRSRDSMGNGMRQAAHDILSPFSLFVEISEFEPSFKRSQFKAFLTRELGKITSGNVGDKVAPLTYRENSGLCAIVEVIREGGYCRATPCSLSWGAFPHITHERIKLKVDEAIRQLPKDGRPCLVVLCSATSDITETDMLYAMLGPRTISINLQSKSSFSYYPLAGIARPSLRTRISALALFHSEYFEYGTKQSMDVYHNPFASAPLSSNAMEKEGIRQLVRVNQTQMGWLN